MADAPESPSGVSLIPIQILFDPVTGNISIQSPLLQNKVLMYGLLDCAKEIVHDAVEKAQESRIVAPFPMRVPQPN